MAVLHDRSGLEAMHRTVAGNQYLRRWLPDVEQALADEALSRRVLDYVGANPSALQKDLHALLEVPAERVTFVCWIAAEAGLLIRAKAGVSYRLTSQMTRFLWTERAMPGFLRSRYRRTSRSPPC